MKGGGGLLKSLKELRKERGITLQHMAEVLGYSGKSGYFMLENVAPRNIPIGKLIVIAKEFNLSVEDLKKILLS